VSGFTIVRDYSHPPQVVWRALTDPSLIPLWTSTGRGGRPVGFAPVAGTRFRYVARPLPGWDGVVECEVLEAREPGLLRYTWKGGEKDSPTTVTCLLEPHGSGTRFTWEHTGFRGLGGFLMSRILASVRRRMLSRGLPEVLAGLAGVSRLR
jgi:uncharacterized protein YndB with AHSA1/START domain